MYRKSKLNVASAEAADNLLFARMQRDALKLEFGLTPDEHELLESFYAPQLIASGTGRAPDHPIGAAHLRFATKFARDFAQNHDNIIEIGPSAVNFAQLAWGNPMAHGCTMFDARDQGRHQNAAMSATLRGLRPNAQTIKKIQVNGLDQKLYHQRVQALASGIPSHTFCVQGWENCTFCAPVAIAIHSLYGITLGQLALGMLNHSCHRIKAWMHFPVQALETDSYTDQTNMYRFQTRHNTKTNTDIVDFNWLGDTSFGYQHDKDTWLNYLKVGGFDTPYGFSVIIEKVKRNGSQFELDIHRTTSSGTFFYQIPNSMIDLVKVPNLREVAVNGFCKRQKIPYIVTDGEKVRKLIQFIHSREDKGRTLTAVKAYARTLVTEVRLGDRIAEHRWSLDFNELSDVCLSVFILATRRNQIDNRVLSKAMVHMSKVADKRGFWAAIMDGIWDVLDYSGLYYHKDKKDLPWSGHHCTDRVLNDQGKNLFKKMFLDFYKDHDCYSSVKEHKLSFPISFSFGAPPPLLPVLGATQIPSGRFPPPPTQGVPITGKTITPSAKVDPTHWSSLIGIRAEIPNALCEDYKAEEQFCIMDQEYQACIHAARADNKTALVTVLEQALQQIREQVVEYDRTGGTGNPEAPYTGPITRKPDKSSVDIPLFHENMAVVMGVPGSRKTTKIVKDVVTAHASERKDAKILFIVPTKRLVESYTKQIQLPNRVLTPHKAIAQFSKFKPTLVIIDEAFTFPMAYINHIAMMQHVICVGDPGQITACDFMKMWQNTIPFTKVQPYLPTMTMMVTYRCPLDIVGLPIMRKMYPGISSASPISSSITHVHAGYKNPQAQTLTLTQLEKIGSIQLNQINAATVHEEQGGTFRSVILHYAGTKAERDLIERSPNHLIVGLTRHTHELFIRDETAVGNETGDIVKFINDSTPLSLYADKANMDLQALTPARNEHQVTIDEDSHEDKADYPTAPSCDAVVEQLLVKYHGALLTGEHQHAMTSELEPKGDCKGRLRLENLGKDEAFESKKHTVYRFTAAQRVKVTKSSDQRMLAKTMLSRLTVATKSMPEAKAKKMAKRLFAQAEPEFDWHVTEDNLHQCFVQAAEKFEENGHNMSELLDIENWKDMNVHQVKAFLKTQQKATTNKDPLTTDKAGQSISAWSKTLNFQVNVWARLLELVLTKQSKGKVIIATGMTDKATMTLLERNHQIDDKHVDNDYTEFDSSQNEVPGHIVDNALVRLGQSNTIECPANVRESLMEMQDFRQISSDVMSLLVSLKLDSGQPFTLIRNCFWNLCIALDTIKGARVIFIKGDDSLALGPNVEFDYTAMNSYVKDLGCNFKPHSAPSGEFVGFIVNKYGAAYDLTRICAKTLTRCYKDKEDFDNYRIAIGVTLREVKQDAAHNMVKVNSYHHTGCTDNIPDFDMLISFLFNFAEGKVPFSNTIAYESRNYITDCAVDVSTHHGIDTSKLRAIPVLKYCKKAKSWALK